MLRKIISGGQTGADMAGLVAVLPGGVGIYEVNILDTGTWTLQDNLTITGQFYQENGTFDANDHNITADNFYFYADNNTCTC